MSVWTIIATLAAVLSAFYALRSNHIAKKALSLAKLDHQSKQADFSLYLIDGYRWVQKKGELRKFLFFHCTIKNKSETKSSYKATLEIEYVRNDDSVARVIIEHQPENIKYIPQKTLSLFPFDIRIEEKAMESRWLLFEQPTSVFNELRIEKFQIKLTDTHGNLATAEYFLIKDFLHDEN